MNLSAVPEMLLLTVLEAAVDEDNPMKILDKTEKWSVLELL